MCRCWVRNKNRRAGRELGFVPRACYLHLGRREGEGSWVNMFSREPFKPGSLSSLLTPRPQIVSSEGRRIVVFEISLCGFRGTLLPLVSRLLPSSPPPRSFVWMKEAGILVPQVKGVSPAPVSAFQGLSFCSCR